MAFTHKGKHLVLFTNGALGAYDELGDAITAAEQFATNDPDHEHRVAWVVPVAEVEDIG